MILTATPPSPVVTSIYLRTHYEYLWKPHSTHNTYSTVPTIADAEESNENNKVEYDFCWQDGEF